MSDFIKIDLLILDSKGVPIKNINVRTNYVKRTSFYEEKTNNFGHRMVSVSENRDFEVHVENPKGRMEYYRTLNSTSARNQIQKIPIKYPISAYSKKDDSGLNKLKLKLVDSDGSVLMNFPIRTGYTNSSKFAEWTTDDHGIVEFQSSKNKTVEFKSLNLDDNFIPIGYANSNESRLIIVKHKFKKSQFLSKTTAKILDIDGSHIYPNAKIQITYNNSSATKVVKNGELNIQTLIGHPLQLTIYKPDNTPFQTKTYVASRMKPKSGFEIRVPVDLKKGITNTEKPQSTQNAPSGINKFISSCIPLYTGNKLTKDDYVNAAKILKCEVAAIKAVAKTESSARGAFQDYLGKKVPTILYERHYFKKYTSNKYTKSHPVVSGKRGNYGKYNAQYPKLLEAMGLDEDAALKSCSWGKFQIMGANYKNCGHANVKEMITDAFKSEKEHLKQFINFVLYDKNLLSAIQGKKWANFAKGYNGPAYADNAYDVKMETAYNHFVKNKDELP